MRKQLAFMLGRQQIFLELNEELEDYDDLIEIMSNTHLNNHFLSLAREVWHVFKRLNCVVISIQFCLLVGYHGTQDARRHLQVSFRQQFTLSFWRWPGGFCTPKSSIFFRQRFCQRRFWSRQIADGGW